MAYEAEEESNVVPIKPIDVLRAERRNAVLAATGSVEDKPEDGARAQELSKATGVHPALIYADLENFEKQHKIDLTNRIVSDDDFIQRWINENPMASKVSSRDIGQLDSVSQKLGDYVKYHPFGHVIEPFLKSLPETAETAKAGFQSIIDIPAKLMATKPDPELAKLVTDFAKQTGLPTDLADTEMELLQRRYQRGEALQAALFGLGQIIGSPAIGMFQHYISKPLEEATGFPAATTEALTIAALAGLGLRTEQRRVTAPERVDMAAAMKLMEFIKAGKEPPVGISPIYDQLKMIEYEKDRARFDEMQREAAKSETKELSPGLFENFVEGRAPGEAVEVRAEAVAKLYGSKLPEAGDGFLGDAVPNLAERMPLEGQSGGYIRMPLAKWLTLDPEVQKALQDDVRIRRGGLSRNEVDIVKEAQQEERLPQLEIGEPAVDAYRAAAGAEPMFDPERPRKLTLELQNSKKEGVGEAREYSFTNVEGKEVGHLHVFYDPKGKELVVDSVGTVLPEERGYFESANLFGPRVIRDLLAQLVKEFPEAETLSGMRVSGARIGKGGWEGTGGEAKIRLRNPEPSTLENLSFHLNVLSSKASLVPPTADLTPGRVFEASLGRKVPIAATFPARDVIDMIEPKELATSSVTYALYHFFGERIKDLAGDVPVYVIPASEYAKLKPGSGAYYDAARHAVIVPTYAIDGTAGKQWAAEHIVHELAHAVTYRAIFANRELYVKFDALRQYVDEYLTSNNPVLREEAMHAYALTNPGEFIAVSWSNLDVQNTLSHMPLPKDLAEVLGIREPAGKTIWDAIRTIIADALERIIGKRPSPTVLDALLQISEDFEWMQKRFPELREPGVKGVVAQAGFRMDIPEPATVPPSERKPVAKEVAKTPGVFGLTPTQHRLYDRLMNASMMLDYENGLKKAEREHTRQQTAEWKANREAMRKEVEEDILLRPDVAANELFRTGTLFGQKVDKPRIDPRFLTDEQKKIVPPEYLRRGGVNPDDIAGQFGFQTGKAMIDRIGLLNQAMKEIGATNKTFISKIVEQETDRRMKERYGNLQQNILEEAKAQVMNETVLDVISEDMLRLATLAGTADLPFDRKAVKSWIQSEFGKATMKEVDSDLYLRDAKSAGTAAEIHLLKGEYGKAYAQKQTQYVAMVKAQEAVKLEKKIDKFDKTMKRFEKREIEAVDQDYTNWIHDIMYRIDRPPDRTLEDLAKTISFAEHQTFTEFVDHKTLFELREMPVAEFLKDPQFRKKYGDLSVEEFRQVQDSIDALIKNGRNEKTAESAGRQEALDKIKGEMIQSLVDFKRLNYDAKHQRWMMGVVPPKAGEWIRGFGAAHIQIESLFNRFDRGNPNGVFTQFGIRDLIESANNEARLEKNLSAEFNKLKDTRYDYKTKVENPNILMDPNSVRLGDPRPIPLTKESIRAIILNMGNESNREKFFAGFNVTPEQQPAFFEWLHRNSTREDWRWAERYGKLFQDFKADHVDPMYRRLTGIAPEDLRVEPFENPHGKFKGWYYPMIYDSVWEQNSRKLAGGNAVEALEGEHYVRATVHNGYIEKRTGYAGPVDLSLDRGVTRLKQMIHDVAFREAVINASKIFYDPDIKAAITEHYGKEYTQLLIPYLKDVANRAATRHEALALDRTLGETLRQNVIGVLIGMNPGTVAKHGTTALYQSIHEVGPANFARAFASVWAKDYDLAKNNWSFALERSDELSRRMRNANEILRGGPDNLFKMGRDPREFMLHMGSYPVGFIDLASAIPTWLAKYREVMESGGLEGDAVFLADRAVRRAHGSTAITNRPEIMRRGNPWFTSLYGFFNHIMNRQYEMAWQANDAFMKETPSQVKFLPDELVQEMPKRGERLTKTRDGIYIPQKAVKGAHAIPGLTMALLAYVLVPALVEEIVSPLPADKDEGYFKWGAKLLAKDISASWIFGREVAHAMLTGHDPTAGIISTGYGFVTNAGRSYNVSKRDPFSKQNFGRTLQDSISLFGAATGLANQQMGREARFMWNYMNGVERPTGWKEWYRGLRYGTIKERH